MSERARVRDYVVLVLAVGMSTAINFIVLAVLYEAIRNPGSSGLSENATQILTGWGGGIIGVVGSYVGFRLGANGKPQDETDTARALEHSAPD